MTRLGHLPCGTLVLATYAAHGQDATQFVQQAVQTELKADAADHSHWLYFESDRKPDDSVKQWVAETGNGDLTRVLEKTETRFPGAVFCSGSP